MLTELLMFPSLATNHQDNHSPPSILTIFSKLYPVSISRRVHNHHNFTSFSTDNPDNIYTTGHTISLWVQDNFKAAETVVMAVIERVVASIYVLLSSNRMNDEHNREIKERFIKQFSKL